jgi:uncharacterized protein (TIGR02118 family)
MMTKMMLLLYKRTDLTADEFNRYWRESHQPLLLQLPGLKKLVLNQVRRDSDIPESACDGISEAWYDSPDAVFASLASPAGQAVAADSPNFLDLSKLQILMVDEDMVLARDDIQAMIAR